MTVHRTTTRAPQGWHPEVYPLKAELVLAYQRLPRATGECRLLEGYERWFTQTMYRQPPSGPRWEAALTLLRAVYAVLTDEPTRKLLTPWVRGATVSGHPETFLETWPDTATSNEPENA